MFNINSLFKKKMPVADAAPGGVIALECITGDPLRITLPMDHCLIAGKTGGGKSTWLNNLVAQAALQAVELWGIDLKSGTELLPWRPVFDELAVDITESSKLLVKLLDLVQRRQRYMASVGKREWDESWGEGPRIMLVVDELAMLTNTKNMETATKQAANTGSYALGALGGLARSAGVMIVLATQVPSKEMIPGSLRDNVGGRIMMRCSSVEHQEMILGSGVASAAGIKISDIPPHNPADPAAGGAGMGWVFSVWGVETPALFRARLLEEDDIERIVDHVIASRPVAEPEFVREYVGV